MLQKGTRGEENKYFTTRIESNRNQAIFRGWKIPLLLSTFKKMLDKYLLGDGLSKSGLSQTGKVSSTSITAMILSALRLHR